jgi:hypothetical protein
MSYTSFFRIPGSKHSQYLRIQSSEYVDFPMLTDGEREREGKGRGIYPLRERTILLKVTPPHLHENS